MLEDALDVLWQYRDGSMLTQSAYVALGGVIGALQRRADAVVEKLGPSELPIVRRMLVNHFCLLKLPDPTRTTAERFQDEIAISLRNENCSGCHIEMNLIYTWHDDSERTDRRRPTRADGTSAARGGYQPTGGSRQVPGADAQARAGEDWGCSSTWATPV